jgi:hypothetical protein
MVSDRLPAQIEAGVPRRNAMGTSMNRTDVTYGQLDAVLRGLGFACRLVTHDPPPARVYEHHESGASIILPAFPEQEKVLEYHLVAARVLLDNYGIADPTTFAARLLEAGRSSQNKGNRKREQPGNSTRTRRSSKSTT